MRKRPAIRKQSGMYLIELLVAIAISAFFAAILGASLGQTMNISNRTENNWFAANIANQVMERVRNTGFDSLPASGQTYTICVNSGDSADTQTYPPGDAITNRELLLNMNDLQWYTGQSGSNVPGYRFTGTVTLSLSDGPVAQISKTATIEVRWVDNSSSTGHVYTMTRMFCKYGLNRYAGSD